MSAQVPTADEERDPVIQAYLRDVDRTLLRKNLRLSHEERFRQLMELQRFAAELREAGRRANRVLSSPDGAAAASRAPVVPPIS